MSSARMVPVGGSSCPLSGDFSSRRRASFSRLSLWVTSDSRHVPCCSFACTEWVHGSGVGAGKVLSFMKPSLGRLIGPGVHHLDDDPAAVGVGDIVEAQK